MYTPQPEPGFRRTQRETTALTISIFSVLLLACLLLLCLALGATGTQASASAEPGLPQTQGAEGCIQTWRVVDAPVLNTPFYGVDALPSGDVWAVGNRVIEHWNGTEWIVFTDTVVLSTTGFMDVVAINPNDVWAAGYRGSNAAMARWNGTEWSEVALPEAGIGYHLLGLDALGANDIWAVGAEQGSTPRDILTLHWDGTEWTRVAPPDFALESAGLHAVAAIATDDVWAVGSVDEGATNKALFIHWDGVEWSVVPNTFENEVVLDVDALATDDVWAVGGSTPGNQMIYHWDGEEWAEQAVAEEAQYLFGIEAIAEDDVWVVGKAASWSYVSHWDGIEWTRVDSPRPGNEIGTLYSITEVSPEEIWSVGGPSLIINYRQWCPEPIVCEPGLNHVDSPNPASTINHLEAVDALSGSDMWAVGLFNIGEWLTGTMTYHWNGSYWEVIPAPIDRSAFLQDVSMIEHDDVWAVGSKIQSSTYVGLSLHWNGEEWTEVDLPTPGGQEIPDLKAVDGIASNDVWATSATSGGTGRGSILHWDGMTWTQTMTYTGVLNEIVAVASNDVWAVGGVGDEALVMHYDGTQWSTVAVPSPGPGRKTLEDISAASANNIWIAGTRTSSGISESFVISWDGAVWTLVDLPPRPGMLLLGIEVMAANDVWAIGHEQGFAVVLHWDGTTWLEVPRERGNGADAEILIDMQAISSNEVWMVGIQIYFPFIRNSLTERFIGSCVTPTVTPSATQTSTHTATQTPASTMPATLTATTAPTQPITETATQAVSSTSTATTQPSTQTSTAVASQSATGVATQTVEPTGTATSTTVTTSVATSTTGSTSTATAPPTSSPEPSTTPTVCAVAFQDVPPGHTFYAQVMCLACEGILSGYPCGGVSEPCGATGDPYFRPGNGITRGQIAKIVSGAAGFTEPVSGQSFEDVPPGATFYEYVERLSVRGIIGGYPCGGVGEPCGAGSLPYFRPNGSATRGQIAKIVSEARGLADPVAAQAFEDVLPESTFYDYIGRLTTLGVMNGYPCGGAGEPCGTGSLPYFRPNNNATRGQTSKIVANTFLPECAP